MFRLKKCSLPKDPTFPTDLKSLGCLIDDRDDTVRSIEYPTEFFRFHASNNERYNEMRREAVHVIIHAEVLKRLKAKHVAPLYLPQLTETRPQDVPNIEILTTPRFKLCQKKRVVVVVNRTLENLGVWSWRMLMREHGITGGSAISFAEETAQYGADSPGLILLNPGQLLYSYRQQTTLTSISWDSQPRPSAVHPITNVHPIHNKVPGNRSVDEHIAYVFEHVVGNTEFVSKDAEIYLIGLGDGGDELVKFLGSNWSKYSPCISALALTAPCKSDIENANFVQFLARRCRAWNLSAHPLDAPLANADNDCMYQQVSGGHSMDIECIMPVAQKSILGWFHRVATGGRDYVNETLEIPEQVSKEAEQRAMDLAGGPAWEVSQDLES